MYQRNPYPRSPDDSSGAPPAAPAGEPPPLSGTKSGGLTGGDQAAIAAQRAANPDGALPDGWLAMERRPDWLPEKFYDAQRKAARLSDFGKAFGEVERKQFTRSDDLRRQVEREFEESRMKARPEKPEGYQAKLPEGYSKDQVELNLDEANPMMKWWRSTAHELGLNQNQFEAGIAAYVDGLSHDMPDIDAEVKSMGENGPQRIMNLEKALTKMLGNDWEVLKPFATSVKAFEALEKLVDARMLAGNQPQGAPAAMAGDGRTREDLRKMMMDPRYRDPYRRDPAFVREVGALQQRLYSQGA